MSFESEWNGHEYGEYGEEGTNWEYEANYSNEVQYNYENEYFQEGEDNHTEYQNYTQHQHTETYYETGAYEGEFGNNGPSVGYGETHEACGQNYGEYQGEYYGESYGEAYGESYGESYEAYGTNYGESYGGAYGMYGQNYGESYGESYGEAYGESYGESYEAYGTNYGESYGESYGEAYNTGVYYGESYGEEAYVDENEQYRRDQIEREEREAREKAEQEERQRKELEAKERAEKEAREKAEREAKEKAEQEAREIAEKEAKEKAGREAFAHRPLPRSTTQPSVRGRGSPIMAGRGRGNLVRNVTSPVTSGNTGLIGGRGSLSSPSLRQQRSPSLSQPSWLQKQDTEVVPDQTVSKVDTQAPVLNRQGQYQARAAAGLGQNRMNRTVSAFPQTSAALRGRGGMRQFSNSLASKPTFKAVEEPQLSQNQIGVTKEELYALPPHDDPNTFRLKLLLEEGHVLLQVVPKTATLDQVKQSLIENTKYNLAVGLVRFKIPGAGFLTNEHESLYQIPYVENAAKRRDDPSFMLVTRGGSYYKQIKADEIQIGSLLNRPIAWQQHDDENTAFRQCMARVRLQERRAAMEDARRIQIGVPVEIGDEVPSKKLLFTLVVNKTMKKTVAGNENETADDFIQRVWKYFPASKSNESWQDYALTAVGKSVYMAGPYKLYDIEYIQRCALSNTEIQLTLIKRSEIDCRKEESTYIFETEEEFLDTDPVIHYDHAVLSSGKGVPGLKSVWDIQTAFNVTIKSITNVPLVQSKYQVVAYLHMTILCGDEYLFGPTRTKEIPLTRSNRTFNCTLPTALLLSDLPRESKLVFSLWVNTPSKKGAKPSCVSWVNCLLYDYKNELRCGPQQLKMWKGNAEPMGTVVGNIDPQAVVLTIEFYAEGGDIVVLPTEPLSYAPYPTEGQPSAEERKMLDQLISQHSLKNLTKEEKELIWKYRRSYCMRFPSALSKFCQSVNKVDRKAVQEMHKLLNEWAVVSPVDALELLDSRYADVYVRRYAITQIEKLTNAQIEDYLLQLVQVLKYECYHDSPLIRHLLKRAIRNKRIGHYLYWYLKSELEEPQVSERFGLLLEAFLKGGGGISEDITAQEKVHQRIVNIAYAVKAHKGADPVSFLRGEVAKLNTDWPKGCQLMLDPLFITKGIKADKCKVMDSKMRPLWLLFENADPTGEDLNIIFKCGDDLRQDMLTLQMFRIMDKLWKKEGLDLMLNPYGVIATGGETGMIEVVTRSNTISKIQKQSAGAVGAFKDEVLFKWLSEKNPDDMSLKIAIENFTASCGGYCVATYVLGIGDRHNDNIMIKEDGHLFHIDFGHILGNFKKKFGFKRERVPFVFTPDWAYVMGGKTSPYYVRFVTQCMQAHQILRANAQLFINLLSMMIISGMPELSSKEDIMYVVDTLNVTTDSSKSNKSFQTILNSTGGQTSTRVNFFIHNLVH